MESNDNLKGIDIKNRPCYYFDDIIRIEDFSFGNILIHEQLYGTRYLVLIGTEKYGAIYNKIGFISQESGIIYVTTHNYSRIKIIRMIFCP